MRAGVVALRIDGDVDDLHRLRLRARACLRACASVASVVGQTSGQEVKPKPSTTTLPR